MRSIVLMLPVCALLVGSSVIFATPAMAMLVGHSMFMASVIITSMTATTTGMTL